MPAYAKRSGSLRRRLRRPRGLSTRVADSCFDALVTQDADLVARCLKDDPAAWDALVARYSRYVYAIIVQAFRLSDNDAEDAYQDVFLRVYDRLGSLRDPEALRPWIAQLTRRVCLDRLSSAGKEEPTEAVEPPGVEEGVHDLDEAFDVHEALDALPGSCREILDRFFTRDESYRTIGEALQLPAGTIASRISRCLVKLREELEGRSAAVLGSGGKREHE
jgi:RNA polymerase sigma factor (sigma-70 family)